jgi:predicted GIY-YIG superfamily endonuclease
MTTKNALYVSKWYERQRNFGLVYKLTIGPETYVGSTRNSLSKRLWQHKSGSVRVVKNAYAEHKTMEIELLEEVGPNDNLRQKEQAWIERLRPSLNLSNAESKDERCHSYKGGVWYKDKWYPTRKLLWQEHGKVPYNTFKVRLHKKPDNFDYALGN